MANEDNLKNGVRFGEGQDPTKGGAPKGKRVSTILKELLSLDSSEIGINDLPPGIEGNKALALELMKIAFSKDNKDKLSAIKEILDRIEGKPLQSVIDKTPSKRILTGITFRDAPEVDLSE